MPTRTTRRTNETNHMPYLIEKGQIGNITSPRISNITKIVIPLLDSVVSNLKEANFFSVFVGKTG